MGKHPDIRFTRKNNNNFKVTNLNILKEIKEAIYK